MDKQVEYLKLLQERNRLKRQMNSKTKEEQINEQLERGFSTHFQGAHSKPKLNKSGMSSNPKVIATAAVPLDPGLLAPAHQKKGWGTVNPGDPGDSRADAQPSGLSEQCVQHLEEPNSVQDAENTGLGLYSGSKAFEEDDLPVMTTQSIEVDNMLMRKIKRLGTKQKKALANLLRDSHDEGVDTDSAEAKIRQFLQEEMNQNVAVKAVEYSLGSAELTGNAGHSATLSSTSNVNPIDQPTCLNFHGTVIIKIRIHSCWDHASKQCSLRAVRLRLVKKMDLNNNDTGLSKELLDGFTVKVFNGPDQLGPTTEAVRTCNSLLLGCKTYRSTSDIQCGSLSKVAHNSFVKDWQSPKASSNILDIILEGTLNDHALDSINSEDGYTVQLVIWNGIDSLSAARDVDVYLGKTCIWSGELPQGSSLDQNNTGETIVVGGSTEYPNTSNNSCLDELRPSLVLFPITLIEGDTVAKKEDISIRVAATASSAGAATLTMPTSKLTGSRIMDVIANNTITRNNDINTISSPAQSTDKPVWLSAVTVAEQTSSLKESPRRNPQLLQKSLSPSSVLSPSPSRSSTKRDAFSLLSLRNSENIDIVAATTPPRSSRSRGSRRMAAEAAALTTTATTTTTIDAGTTSSTSETFVDEPPPKSSGTSRVPKFDENWKNASAQKLPKRNSVYRYSTEDGDVPGKTQSSVKEDAVMSTVVTTDWSSINESIHSPVTSNETAVLIAEVSGTSSARKSRRPRTNVLSNVPSGTVGDSFSVISTPTSDQDMQKSLDAVAHAEKYNFGRLSISTGKPSAQTIETRRHQEEEDEEEEGFTSQPLAMIREESGSEFKRGIGDNTGTILETGLGDRAKSPHAHNLKNEPDSCEEPSPESDKMLNTMTEQRSQRNGDRSLKINKVQGKLNNALANLATIMSQLPNANANENRNHSDMVHVSSRPGSTSCDKEKFVETRQADGRKVDRIITEVVSNHHATAVRIDIMSTWGDSNYVGLNGVELFDRKGELISLSSSNVSVETYPADINLLARYNNDPRVAKNLIDGVNFTRNDLHVWLAPQIGTLRSHDPALYTQVQDKLAKLVGEEESKIVIATILIRCKKEFDLSAMRIFNYNKSRAHNQRGVKGCRVLINNNVVYEGDICKASGTLLKPSSESQLIMLTANRDLCKAVESAVKLVDSLALKEDDDILEESMVGLGNGPMMMMNGHLLGSSSAAQLQRPSTAEGGDATTTQNNVISESHSSAINVVNEVVSTQETTVSTDMHQGKRDTNDTDNILSQLENLNLLGTDQRQSSSSIVAQSGHHHLDPLSAIQKRNRQQVGGSVILNEGKDSALTEPVSATNTIEIIEGRHLKMNILSTWGDRSYVGLSGLEVLILDNGVVKAANIEQIDASPRDLSAVGFFDDPRTLTNLLNGFNDCANDEFMWLVPYTQGSEHFIKIDLGCVRSIVGVRIWNYNRASEDILRGCKEVHFLVDGCTISDHNVILRRGPGMDGVAFGQTIIFSSIAEASSALTYKKGSSDDCADKSSKGGGVRGLAARSSLRYVSPVVKQDYETQHLPTGLTWQFTILENWNDHYYVGLDKIEFYGCDGKLLDVISCGALVTAVPPSVRVLQYGNKQDPRTPDKLFSASVGGPSGGGRCWLSPLSQCMTVEERAACAHSLIQEQRNRAKVSIAADRFSNNYSAFSFPVNNTLIIQFPFPVAISAVRLYNYSKSPARGVKDFALHADGDLLYMGSIQTADREKRLDGRSRGQTIMFSGNPKLINALKDTVSYAGSTEQDVLCINEKQVMVRSRNMYNQEPPNIAWEGVTADLDKRPATSLIK